MDLNEVSANFVSFMKAWLDSGVVPVENWKFVVKRAIPELENQIADMPKLSILLTKGLIWPLIKQGTMQMSDLVWYRDEEKDELLDLRGQFNVAACLLDCMANDGKTKDALTSEFKGAHGAAFTHM